MGRRAIDRHPDSTALPCQSPCQSPGGLVRPAPYGRPAGPREPGVRRQRRQPDRQRSVSWRRPPCRPVSPCSHVVPARSLSRVISGTACRPNGEPVDCPDIHQLVEAERPLLPQSGRAGADLCQGDERRALWALSGVTARGSCLGGDVGRDPREEPGKASCATRVEPGPLEQARTEEVPPTCRISRPWPRRTR